MNPVFIDCRNMPCPQPVMKLLELFKSSRPADLDVIVDNLAGLENVSRFLRSKGYAASYGEEGALWRIRAHTDAAGPAPEGGANSAPEDLPSYACRPAAEDMRTLVLIITPVFGSGDDELGGRLMKNFLGTLPEIGSALWRIILLNGGVTLAAEGSPVLEQLRNLEKSGVSILVCGTCLEHFGLLAKKAVGETTNMLDVVTSMAAASKIIRV
ncbi:sulfurtransferase-like selenium metabolism protein YedF [Desulfovibrio sp. OttesenSCG-928-A18]|nr:sulfurtransferase-like selenium metabolism protein YedF [Desulfovibrio sp. OttesenSCG-928-A18]